jgi:hypothetical protein
LNDFFVKKMQWKMPTKNMRKKRKMSGFERDEVLLCFGFPFPPGDPISLHFDPETTQAAMMWAAAKWVATTWIATTWATKWAAAKWVMGSIRMEGKVGDKVGSDSVGSDSVGSGKVGSDDMGSDSVGDEAGKVGNGIDKRLTPIDRG